MKITRDAVYVLSYDTSDIPHKYRDAFPSVFYETRGADVLYKLNKDLSSYSVLFYEDFWKNPHPSLLYSFKKYKDRKVYTQRDYRQSKNKPILHRKEEFISYQLYAVEYERFAALTKQEEEAGLYDKEHLYRIGYSKYWNELLDSKNLVIVNHILNKKRKK